MALFETTIKPRFYETDALGHISNTVPPAWWEVGRSEFLSAMSGGLLWTWFTASITIDYVGETFCGKDVTLRVTGTKVGNTSLTIYAEMLQDDKVTIRCSAVLVHMDAEKGVPSPVPDEYRAALAGES